MHRLELVSYYYGLLFAMPEFEESKTKKQAT